MGSAAVGAEGVAVVLGGAREYQATPHQIPGKLVVSVCPERGVGHGIGGSVKIKERAVGPRPARWTFLAPKNGHHRESSLRSPSVSAVVASGRDRVDLFLGDFSPPPPFCPSHGYSTLPGRTRTQLCGNEAALPSSLTHTMALNTCTDSSAITWCISCLVGSRSSGFR